jgi:hypothetical protein
MQCQHDKGYSLVIAYFSFLSYIPIEKNKDEIQKIVLDKASWILQKQREIREKNT